MATRHMKFYNGMTSVSGVGQARVYGYTTKGDFMAMTGNTADYVAEGGSHEVCVFLMHHPNVLFYSARNTGTPSADDLRPVPESELKYKSAKDKKEWVAKAKLDHDRLVAEHAAEMEAARAARLERVARKLYGFDQHNVAWEEADPSQVAKYRQRAADVIAVL